MNKFLIITVLFSSLLSAQTRIIAHRGFWKTENSAQNSISSLKNAQKLKVYGSEFDVRMTKDGKLVINHDEHIDNLEISESNDLVLRKLKLKNGEHLPTLKNYLKQGKKDASVKLIVELKPAKTLALEKEIVEKVLNEIKKFNLEDQTEFISFSLHICKELKKQDPQTVVQYLNGELSPMQLKEIGLNGFDYHFKVLQKNPTWVSEAKSLGLITNSWTVNDEKIYAELKNMGIDFVTTDIPNELKNK
jgi:glycerophosphoryl diester phosphodiesterase